MKTPPIKDAIATKQGWAHPVTGELLVSQKGLPNPIEYYRPNASFPQQIPESIKQAFAGPKATNTEPQKGEPEPVVIAETDEQPEVVAETIGELVKRKNALKKKAPVRRRRRTTKKAPVKKTDD